MRFLLIAWIVLSQIFAVAQGTAPPDPAQPAQAQSANIQAAGKGCPPEPQDSSTLHRMTLMIKQRINKAIDGNPYPEIASWQPLTTKEKFEVFRQRTYSPLTFASAAIGTLKDNVLRKRNPEYEHGPMGFGQQFGVSLGMSETEVFFGRFLMPSLLKQDPRYFRNPELPFMKRAFYSMSRVVITRSDKGHDTFNSSSILGQAFSQALADLYVPGQRQGLMHPIAGTIGFNLVRDAGLNLLHEFWPDLRRKFLHR